MPDITEFAHERDGEGGLIPVEKTVAVRGEGEADVEVIPATSGQRRAWQRRLEDEAEELSDDAEADLFEEFLPYDPADFNNAESWNDIRPALSDALANAIFAELFDTESDDFSVELEQAIEEHAAEATEGNPN